MEKLWAPWRMEYIVQDKSDDCIFCTLPHAGEDEKNKILHKGPLCFVVMNIFPYNNGHIMISPYRHVPCITDLTGEEIDQLGRLTQKSTELLRTAYSPDGFNVGYNIGESAGAGYVDHLHTHIVPRWTGDTNFMPVLAETKVHPEHLQATYQRLAPLFQNLTL